MQNQPVIVFSPSMGSFVGILQGHEGKWEYVTLGPARAVRWDGRETHVMDVAAEGLPKRLSSVSAQIAGPIHLADVTLIAPLSRAACQSIVRVSEDNLSLLTPVPAKDDPLLMRRASEDAPLLPSATPPPSNR